MLRNRDARPVRVELRFLVHSLVARQLKVRVGDVTLYDQPLPAGRKGVSLKVPELPPGETKLRFFASGPPTKPDDFTSGAVIFKIDQPHLRIVP